MLHKLLRLADAAAGMDLRFRPSYIIASAFAVVLVEILSSILLARIGIVYPRIRATSQRIRPTPDYAPVAAATTQRLGMALTLQSKRKASASCQAHHIVHCSRYHTTGQLRDGNENPVMGFGM